MQAFLQARAFEPGQATEPALAKTRHCATDEIKNSVGPISLLDPLDGFPSGPREAKMTKSASD